CALIFSCYSDSCYDPPHLQSFPTRRSSDLRALHLVRPGRLARGSRGDSAASTCVQNLIGIPRCCWWPVSTTGTSLAIACTPRRLDRKSTRLNSSHVKISYAVFCLKKKTQQR